MPAPIHVTFLDADTGSILGETDIPADRLPPSFATPTTLELGDDRWSVVRAEPLTAEEFVRTGKLRLEMRRIVMMDPRTILFSLPTISDELPACEPVDEPSSFVLREDDWRQIEFVAPACAAETAACIAEIQRIHREHRKPSGAFDALHVRKEVPEPFRGAVLPLKDLQAALPGATDTGGIFLAGNGRVLDGFGLRLSSGSCLYGLAPSGLIRVLGMFLPEEVEDPGADEAALLDLAAARGLMLVHWCAARILNAEDNEGR